MLDGVPRCVESRERELRFRLRLEGGAYRVRFNLTYTERDPGRGPDSGPFGGAGRPTTGQPVMLAILAALVIAM